jgi:hypothetical protein
MTRLTEVIEMRDWVRRRRPWRLLALFATHLVLQGCNSGLTVSPTIAGPSPLPTPPPPVTDVRVTIFLRGALDDGGSFEGYITYGDRDQDERPGFGRYQGGLWELVVRGGARTRDARFANGTGGRALIETNSVPFPAIGLVFLWPDVDPVLQGLTPHVRPPDGYDPERQPTVREFGPLIPGSPATFGTFVDGAGGEAVVISLEVR